MFRIASDDNIDEYADSVCEFIRTCVEDVVPIATIKTFPNQKPWIDGSIRVKLKARTTAFNQGKVTGNMTEYKQCNYSLRKAIKQAKRQYRDKVESQFNDTLDPLQFAYSPNRSTDDAISTTLHTALTHLDKRNTYVRMLFIDYSSAFNTIVPSKLIIKIETLGLDPALCNWVLDFLTLNVNKTKEMIVDFRKQQSEHPPIHIDGTVVERVVSFKFLGVHITDKLNWSTHTDSIMKKAQQRLFNLRRLKKFGLSPKALTNFYRCTIESILSGCITAWYGNCSAHNRKALQRVVRSAQRITGGKLPALQDTYTTRCHRKAIKIIKDSNHPSHCLFTPLSSRRRGQYRCIKAGTERLKNSFYLKAIRLLNSHH
uniref:Alkylated DNA repair protein AlkB homologue 8 N-terminal domain-containing protein n=1 Tax=Oncorhynchus kisutch TaxID=8019 RepID=A0A8C7H559_ONCKI